MSAVMDHLLRPGSKSSRDIQLDVLWLLGFSVLLIATGIGLRDPWPADEPRFALIVRDMVATGEWLIPHIGGDTYADKPPLFFWLMSCALIVTDSLRVAFLLPSLLAGVGCVLLIYDIARRLWNRENGLLAALLLLMTVQFVWQARQAQIDALLCFWTTLSLYALLRHLLLGPAWGWYALGWGAAGLGIITKGVGFLPLLILLPYALARGYRWHPRLVRNGGWRWLIGPVALVAAVSIWLVPMLWAASINPELAAYRDEILFGQTVNRYVAADQHRQPFWYFIIAVIPVLWLPLTALLPWLLPRWREDFRQRDLRVLLPLAWTVIVVIFFSLSSGKRGVYVLPALPALVLACAPHLGELRQRIGAQRALLGIACTVAAVTLITAGYGWVRTDQRQELIELYGLDVIGPLLAIGFAAAISCLVAGARRGWQAYGATLIVTLLVVSFWANPEMNEARSSAAFIRRVESMSAEAQLGLVAYREQYLLYLTRPTVNFGHSRWREGSQEAADAAAWLGAAPGRTLLVNQQLKDLCFTHAEAREAGVANRQTWFLVSGEANASCVGYGNAAAARTYGPGQ